MVILPTMPDLRMAIKLAEDSLALEEHQAVLRREDSWNFKADNLLEEWANRVVVEGSSWPVIQYELVFFTVANKWNRERPHKWPADLEDPQAASDQMIVPLVVGNESRPSKSFPTRTLPLSIFNVLLLSLSQLLSLRQDLPLSRDFARFLVEADYLMSLCETTSPTASRRNRPASLSSAAPAQVLAPADFTWSKRLYCWPTAILALTETYNHYSSSPHAAITSTSSREAVHLLHILFSLDINCTLYFIATSLLYICPLPDSNPK